MPPRPSEQLVAWLERQLSSLSPGERLPTDLELAKTFGVSESTVKRVLKTYTVKGRIVRVPGKGTFLPAPSNPPDLAVAVPQSSATSLAHSLYQAISRGEIKYGEPLPQVKYLCYRFKVTKKTVTAAYRELAAKGYALKVGKTFWAGTPQSLFRGTDRKKDILFFNYDSYDFSETFQKDRMAKAHAVMEKELSSRGFFLYFENTRDLADLFGTILKQDKIPHGMIFLLPYMADKKVKKAKEIFPVIQRFLDRVPAGKPRLLFEMHNVWYNRELKSKIWILARGHILTSSARALSEYLARRRYAQAALFIDEDKPIWDFPNMEFPLIRILRELKRMKPDFRYTVFRKTSRDPRGLLDAELLNDIIRRESDGMKISFAELAANMVFTKNPARCFKEALKYPVWVFSTAPAAAGAVAWAQKNDVDVPRQCAIITLDNDPRFYHLGLTYCGPDWDAIGYLMAHAIIGDLPIAKTSQGFIRTVAVVLEKLTTLAG